MELSQRILVLPAISSARARIYEKGTLKSLCVRGDDVRVKYSVADRDGIGIRHLALWRVHMGVAYNYSEPTLPAGSDYVIRACVRDNSRVGPRQRFQ